MRISISCISTVPTVCLLIKMPLLLLSPSPFFAFVRATQIILFEWLDFKLKKNLNTNPSRSLSIRMLQIKRFVSRLFNEYFSCFSHSARTSKSAVHKTKRFLAKALYAVEQSMITLVPNVFRE